MKNLWVPRQATLAASLTLAVPPGQTFHVKPAKAHSTTRKLCYETRMGTRHYHDSGALTPTRKTQLCLYVPLCVAKKPLCFQTFHVKPAWANRTTRKLRCETRIGTRHYHDSGALTPTRKQWFVCMLLAFCWEILVFSNIGCETCIGTQHNTKAPLWNPHRHTDIGTTLHRQGLLNPTTCKLDY